MSGEWAIDAQLGLQAFARYAAAVNFVGKGGNYADLGYSEMRKSERAFLFINPDGTRGLTEAEQTPEAGAVAIFQLTGTMMLDGAGSSYGTRSLANAIIYAASLTNIEGILLKVNTGGGQVLAAQNLFNAIEQVQIPVVVHADVMASGGIWGTLPAAEIIAAGEESIIGSIGVYMSFNAKKLEKIKNNWRDIYAAQSPQKNSDFRRLLEGDESILQNRMNETAVRFQNLVRRYRPALDASPLADDTLEGGIFKATEAKERGLIDGIGNEAYALRRLRAHISYKI